MQLAISWGMGRLGAPIDWQLAITRPVISGGTQSIIRPVSPRSFCVHHGGLAHHTAVRGVSGACAPRRQPWRDCSAYANSLHSIAASNAKWSPHSKLDSVINTPQPARECHSRQDVLLELEFQSPVLASLFRCSCICANNWTTLRTKENITTTIGLRGRGLNHKAAVDSRHVPLLLLLVTLIRPL